MAKRSKKRCEELPILHPDAAGIYVGASEASCLLQSALIVIPNLSAVSLRSYRTKHRGGGLGFSLRPSSSLAEVRHQH